VIARCSCLALGIALALSAAGCVDERLIGTRAGDCDGGEPCPPPSMCDDDDDDDDPNELPDDDDDCELDEGDGSVDDDALPDF
jgi:hypothetical protein